MCLLTKNIVLLHFLDWFFLTFHFSLIIFILFGWIWRKLRFYNLIVILLTFGSWFILGIWYGFGYCPFTDWHWQVLRELDNECLPASYVSYLFQRILGVNLSQDFVDWLTGGLAAIAFIVSLVFNYRDLLYKNSKK